MNAAAQLGTDVVIKMLESLTGAMVAAKGISENHPKLVTALAEAVVALAAAFAGMSVAALVAIGGPAGAIAGAVAAIGMLVAIHWDEISKGFTTVQTA